MGLARPAASTRPPWAKRCGAASLSWFQITACTGCLANSTPKSFSAQARCVSGESCAASRKGDRPRGNLGQRVGRLAAGNHQRHEQGQAERAPAVELAAELQHVARLAAVGRVADVDLQPDAGQSQFGPHQGIGEVQRRQLAILSADERAPWLVDRDHDRRPWIDAADGFDRDHGQPQPLFIVLFEVVGDVEPRGALPELHFAAVARDDGLDVRGHASTKTLALVLAPQVHPVGQRPLVDGHQGTAGHLQPVGAAPFDLPVAGRPIALVLAGLDVAPGQRHDGRVERRQHLSGQRVARQPAAQLDAQQRAQLAALLMAGGQGLRDVGTVPGVDGGQRGADGLERPARGGLRVVAARGGPRQVLARRGQGCTDFARQLHAERLPGAELVAQPIERAARELDLQVVGLVALHQAGSRKHQLAVPLDRAGDEQVA